MTEKEKMISQKLFRDDDFLNEEKGQKICVLK